MLIRAIRVSLKKPKVSSVARSTPVLFAKYPRDLENSPTGLPFRGFRFPPHELLVDLLNVHLSIVLRFEFQPLEFICFRLAGLVLVFLVLAIGKSIVDGLIWTD